MKTNYHAPYHSEKFYHIYNHASNVDNLFEEENDCLNFLNKFDKYFSTYFDLLAYCLMPNHYHFIIRVKKENKIRAEIVKPDSNAMKKYILKEVTLDELIRDQFRRFHSSISLRHNAKYKRKGQLLLNRHKDVIVTPQNLVDRICYVHHNPIHHDFCVDYTDWKYSSYETYIKKWVSKLNTELTLKYFIGLDSFIDTHIKYKSNYIQKMG